MELPQSVSRLGGKPRRRMPKVYLNQERDFPLLGFLWRFKVATTSALCAKFFPKTSSHVAYKRLSRLEKGKFIESHVDPTGRHYVWTLSKKGFEAIRNELPPLREEGFRSENKIHDLLVMGAHLGNFFYEKPKNVGLITEQELRRVDLDSFPNWLPKEDIHRPDGYWRIQNEGEFRTIGLEVELSPKARSIYESVDDFYRNVQIDSVIWIISNLGLQKRIQKSVSKNHFFFRLSDFLEHGWNAKCQKEKSVSIGNLIGESLGTDTELVPMLLVLNTRKSPHKSKECVTTLWRENHD